MTTPEVAAAVAVEQISVIWKWKPPVMLGPTKGDPLAVLHQGEGDPAVQREFARWMRRARVAGRLGRAAFNGVDG